MLTNVYLDIKSIRSDQSDQIRSDQISHSVVSDSLWPHESQHARPPCPSPTPGVHWDSCPSSQWCHPTTCSSVAPFSFCPQSFPTSGSFPMSWVFASGGQSIGHLRDYLGCEDLFLYSFFVYFCHLFLISSASVRSIPFLSFIEF